MRLAPEPWPVGTRITPVPRSPRCTSMPHWVSFSATVPEVRTSSKPISGCACRSRRMAVSSSAKPSMRSIRGMLVVQLSDVVSSCGIENGAVRLDADAGTQARPGQRRWVGRHRAGRGADQQLFSDRLEIGAEMHRALIDENGLFGRLGTDIAVPRLIGELRLVRTHGHA